MAGLFKIIAPFTSDDLNEATNPSLETATTGWSSTGTFAQSSEQQWRGKYSGKVTVPASTTLASYAITLATQNTTYYLFSVAHVASNWNGGNISMNVASLTGSSVTIVKQFINGTDPYTTWIILKSRLSVATDVTGSITWISSSTPTAGRIIYIDALYVSTKDGEYFDGDDDMAFWTGLRHASTSKMDFRNRLHGTLTDPQDFYVHLCDPIGGDFAPISNSIRARALGHGAEFQNTYIGPRLLNFVTTIEGHGSLTTYHSRKKQFENLIKHNATPTRQPFLLQYTGANENNPLYLPVYTDAFEMRLMGYTGQGALRLLAPEPFLYEKGDKYLALTRSTSLSVSYILGWLNDGTGFSALGNTGTGTVHAIAIDDNNDVFVGGNFLNWDGIANADYLVRYNRSTNTWAAPFSPSNGIVRDLRFIDDGDLIIVGEFTSIGGSALNRVARWNGTAISGFGTGFNGIARAIAFDYQRGILYFVGDFTTANGVTVNRVARYTLSTGVFTAMDSGVSAAAYAVKVDQANGDVYVGGAFLTAGAGATTVNHVVKWNYATAAWETIGGTGEPGVNDPVNSLAIYGNYVYIGGDFTETGEAVQGETLNYLGRYKLGEQSRTPIYPVGPKAYPGVNSFVQSILPYAGKLLITGKFTQTTGGLIADNVVLWNGTTFEPLGLNFPGAGTAFVYEFAQSKNGDYFFGFDSTGTMLVPSALNSVTNNGTTDAHPVFYFDSSGQAVGTDNARLDIIANRTTGKTINFNGVNLLEGARVIVDTWKQKIYRVVGQDIFDITDGAVRRDSDWSDFTLQPGVNEIMIAAPDVTGTPTITAYMLYRNRHHSLSGSAP